MSSPIERVTLLEEENKKLKEEIEQLKEQLIEKEEYMCYHYKEIHREEMEELRKENSVLRNNSDSFIARMKHPKDCCDDCMVYDPDGNWTGYSGKCVKKLKEENKKLEKKLQQQIDENLTKPYHINETRHIDCVCGDNYDIRWVKNPNINGGWYSLRCHNCDRHGCNYEDGLTDCDSFSDSDSDTEDEEELMLCQLRIGSVLYLHNEDNNDIYSYEDGDKIGKLLGFDEHGTPDIHFFVK